MSQKQRVPDAYFEQLYKGSVLDLSEGLERDVGLVWMDEKQADSLQAKFSSLIGKSKLKIPSRRTTKVAVECDVTAEVNIKGRNAPEVVVFPRLVVPTNNKKRGNELATIKTKEWEAMALDRARAALASSRSAFADSDNKGVLLHVIKVLSIAPRVNHATEQELSPFLRWRPVNASVQLVCGSHNEQLWLEYYTANGKEIAGVVPPADNMGTPGETRLVNSSIWWFRTPRWYNQHFLKVKQDELKKKFLEGRVLDKNPAYNRDILQRLLSNKDANGKIKEFVESVVGDTAHLTWPKSFEQPRRRAGLAMYRTLEERIAVMIRSFLWVDDDDDVEHKSIALSECIRALFPFLKTRPYSKSEWYSGEWDEKTNDSIVALKDDYRTGLVDDMSELLVFAMTQQMLYARQMLRVFIDLVNVDEKQATEKGDTPIWRLIASAPGHTKEDAINRFGHAMIAVYTSLDHNLDLSQVAARKTVFQRMSEYHSGKVRDASEHVMTPQEAIELSATLTGQQAFTTNIDKWTNVEHRIVHGVAHRAVYNKDMPSLWEPLTEENKFSSVWAAMYKEPYGGLNGYWMVRKLMATVAFHWFKMWFAPHVLIPLAITTPVTADKLIVVNSFRVSDLKTMSGWDSVYYTPWWDGVPRTFDARRKLLSLADGSAVPTEWAGPVHVAELVCGKLLRPLKFADFVKDDFAHRYTEHTSDVMSDGVIAAMKQLISELDQDLRDSIVLNKARAEAEPATMEEVDCLNASLAYHRDLLRDFTDAADVANELGHVTADVYLEMIQVAKKRFRRKTEKARTTFRGEVFHAHGNVFERISNAESNTEKQVTFRTLDSMVCHSPVLTYRCAMCRTLCTSHLNADIVDSARQDLERYESKHRGFNVAGSLPFLFYCGGTSCQWYGRLPALWIKKFVITKQPQTPFQTVLCSLDGEIVDLLEFTTLQQLKEAFWDPAGDTIELYAMPQSVLRRPEGGMSPLNSSLFARHDGYIENGESQLLAHALFSYFLQLSKPLANQDDSLEPSQIEDWLAVAMPARRCLSAFFTQRMYKPRFVSMYTDVRGVAYHAQFGMRLYNALECMQLHTPKMKHALRTELVRPTVTALSDENTTKWRAILDEAMRGFNNHTPAAGLALKTFIHWSELSDASRTLYSGQAAAFQQLGGMQSITSLNWPSITSCGEQAVLFVDTLHWDAAMQDPQHELSQLCDERVQIDVLSEKLMESGLRELESKLDVEALADQQLQEIQADDPENEDEGEGEDEHDAEANAERASEAEKQQEMEAEMEMATEMQREADEKMAHVEDDDEPEPLSENVRDPLSLRGRQTAAVPPPEDAFEQWLRRHTSRPEAEAVPSKEQLLEELQYIVLQQVEPLVSTGVANQDVYNERARQHEQNVQHVKETKPEELFEMARHRLPDPERYFPLLPADVVVVLQEQLKQEKTVHAKVDESGSLHELIKSAQMLNEEKEHDASPQMSDDLPDGGLPEALRVMDDMKHDKPRAGIHDMFEHHNGIEDDADDEADEPNDVADLLRKAKAWEENGIEDEVTDPSNAVNIRGNASWYVNLMRAAYRVSEFISFSSKQAEADPDKKQEPKDETGKVAEKLSKREEEYLRNEEEEDSETELILDSLREIGEMSLDRNSDGSNPPAV